MSKLHVNGRDHTVDTDPATPIRGTYARIRAAVADAAKTLA